jgi:hypothetical protein
MSNKTHPSHAILRLEGDTLVANTQQIAATMIVQEDEWTEKIKAGYASDVVARK